MATRIYEYIKSENFVDVNKDNIVRDYTVVSACPIIAKGNIYQGIPALW